MLLIWNSIWISNFSFYEQPEEFAAVVGELLNELK